MAKVICTHPSATSAMSVTGEVVKFVAHELGMISEEISEEMAKLFLECQGFRRHGKAPKGEPIDPAGAAQTDTGKTNETAPASGAGDTGKTGVKAPDF